MANFYGTAISGQKKHYVSHPTIEDIYDPFLMHDMEKAVASSKVEAGEQILVYGDYDADGITSTTVMKEAIELVGWFSTFYRIVLFMDMGLIKTYLLNKLNKESN